MLNPEVLCHLELAGRSAPARPRSSVAASELLFGREEQEWVLGAVIEALALLECLGLPCGFPATPGRQQGVAQVVGFLPPSGEIWVEFWTPGFSLSKGPL